MKAFLLAAGKGTRLHPLTHAIPKCLVPINGVPLLEIWLALLENSGITDVLINTHHLADQVEGFLLERRLRGDNRMNVVTVREEVLLGSAGTIWANRNFVTGEEDFVIAYADNLTDVDLLDMVAWHGKHREKGCVLTMGLFQAANPRACGIAELDQSGKIVAFVEKPENPLSDSANAGIYVASHELFNYFQIDANHGSDHAVMDLGHDVLPKLVGNMFGYKINRYLRDIGTLESYHAAQKEWPPER